MCYIGRDQDTGREDWKELLLINRVREAFPVEVEETFIPDPEEGRRRSRRVA